MLRNPYSYLLLLPLACATPRSPEPAPVSAAAPAAKNAPENAAKSAPVVSAGVDEAALDRAVDPCQDFYKFACGGWIKNTPIPPDRPAWFRSFSEIDERNTTLLRSLLEGYARGESREDPNAQKLGDYYATCMDEANAETAGVAALRAELSSIDGMKALTELPERLAALHLGGTNVFFGVGSQQDFKDATRVIAVVDQGGLGLPDRDYYLKKDAKSVELLRAYEAHVATMMELGATAKKDAAREAKSVLRIESALAQASMSRVDRRNPEKIYNRLERAGLQRVAPKFSWDRYFAAIGAPDVQELNVASPGYFAGLNKELSSLSVADARAYLKWRVVDDAASALGKAFVDQDFAFSSKHLTGAERILPRWKRCVHAVEGGMGQALGRPFVARTFGQDGKARTDALIKAIERSFAENLAALSWMDAPTRAQAQQKLERIYNKVGFPDKWRTYDSLTIDRSSYLQNSRRAAAFENKRDLAKIGKPLDRSEWLMPPQAVNAYYDPSMNEMVFPAGILQPPFFDRARGDVENFGAIGMVMGHELTHGFDDEGRKFDAAGNLREWWSPAVGKAFEDRAACVVKQYDGYSIAPGVNVNGKLTLGENIADVGGLKMAHRASQSVRAAEPSGAAFSAEQRFFLSFAQGWCSSRRDQYARMLVTVDPHAPPEFRVNGPIANTPAFAEAFSCKAGSPMAPVNRCQVW